MKNIEKKIKERDITDSSLSAHTFSLIAKSIVLLSLYSFYSLNNC